MASVFAATAGLAILSTGLVTLPRAGVKGLLKALAVATSLGVGAAFLITAAHTVGP